MTVGIGVVVRYAGLVVVDLVWALFVLDDRPFASTGGRPGRSR
ncbi:hypothetical protein [Streptomyces sp. NK15101]|nr:hypothetical protein [Streptomyces sp. NK15101]